MAVVGLTCHLDVLSSLEKRIRSRFSHRQMLVSRPSFREVRQLQAPLFLYIPYAVLAAQPTLDGRQAALFTVASL
jgi:hypothetical protein